MALQTIVSRQANAASEPTVVSVGQITGGNRYNIIADSVTLEGTVRTLTKDGPAWAKERMDAILKGITSTVGATYTLDYKFNAPLTFNDPALTQRVAPGARSGRRARRTWCCRAQQMGAEDFAYYQQKMPGLFFFLGVGNPEKKITAMIHTEYFDMDEAALPLGARAMSTVVLDYLFRSRRSSPSRVAQRELRHVGSDDPPERIVPRLFAPSSDGVAALPLNCSSLPFIPSSHPPGYPTHFQARPRLTGIPHALVGLVPAPW